MRQLSGDAEGPGSFGSLPVNMFHANLVPPHSEKEVSADVMYFQPDGGFDCATRTINPEDATWAPFKVDFQDFGRTAIGKEEPILIHGDGRADGEWDRGGSSGKPVQRRHQPVRRLRSGNTSSNYWTDVPSHLGRTGLGSTGVELESDKSRVVVRQIRQDMIQAHFE